MKVIFKYGDGSSVELKPEDNVYSFSVFGGGNTLLEAIAVALYKEDKSFLISNRYLQKETDDLIIDAYRISREISFIRNSYSDYYGFNKREGAEENYLLQLYYRKNKNYNASPTEEEIYAYGEQIAELCQSAIFISVFFGRISIKLFDIPDDIRKSWHEQCVLKFIQKNLESHHVHASCVFPRTDQRFVLDNTSSLEINSVMVPELFCMAKQVKLAMDDSFNILQKKNSKKFCEGYQFGARFIGHRYATSAELCRLFNKFIQAASLQDYVSLSHDDLYIPEDKETICFYLKPPLDESACKKLYETGIALEIKNTGRLCSLTFTELRKNTVDALLEYIHKNVSNSDCLASNCQQDADITHLSQRASVSIAPNSTLYSGSNEAEQSKTVPQNSFSSSETNTLNLRRW